MLPTSPTSLQELCSVVVVKNVKKRNSIKHLEIPTQLKSHLFDIWKRYQMENYEIQQFEEEINSKFPPCCAKYSCAVFTCYSHEDHPPKPPSLQTNPKETEYSYCFDCNKELNLSLEKRTYTYEFNTTNVLLRMIGRPYSFFGYCDNCMVPLYEVNAIPGFSECDSD